MMDIPSLIKRVTDPNEETHAIKLKSYFIGKEALVKYFEEIEEEGAMPDLCGKTVLVTAVQFPRVHEIVQEVASFLEIKPPTCFVYDNYKQVIDSEGLKNPRLEISARMVRNFTPMELRHAIAKEMFHIKAGHLWYEVLTEKMMETLAGIPGLGIAHVNTKSLVDGWAFHFKSIAFNWFKFACFSAENFAIVYAGDIKASISATLLSIFNERELAKAIDVSSFIRQIEKIEACTGPMATLEKINEVIPYGPYRILNMLRFVLSDNGRELFGRIGKTQGV
jgi:hypothetical protein